MKKLIPMINEVGRHYGGKITRKCDGKLSAFAFVKAGSEAGSVAATTAPTEQPIGTAMHDTDAKGDDVAIELPGGSPGTKLAVAGGAISALARICAGEGGKAVALPSAAGTYWVVGRALTAATAEGDEIEFEGCVPYPVTVA
jgi:hypothetical protein